MFSGTIFGFADDDGIDLTNIAFSNATTLTYAANAGDTGGILTVTSGTQSAEISFSGHYVVGNFTASSDGHGGTLIVDPPVGDEDTRIAGQLPSVMARATADAFHFSPHGRHGEVDANHVVGLTNSHIDMFDFAPVNAANRTSHSHGINFEDEVPNQSSRLQHLLHKNDNGLTDISDVHSHLVTISYPIHHHDAHHL